MTTYSRDSEGKFIPATQRLDGTWRKARRVKDGYVPQEEVPLYESKGKLFGKKPDIPVGMCPLIAQQQKEKRDKQQKKNKANPAPGIIVLPKNQTTSKPAKPAVPKERIPAPKEPKEVVQPAQSVNDITESLADVDLGDDHMDLGKKLKKLRKKIREIEALEAKIKSGEVKKPGKDQLDKIKRKQLILEEIAELEQQNN
uniref:Partner of Y14 and mago n=1 Tax=Tabanus bromius TaxID=304241 RepID=A0A0K8TK69_TABBR